MIQLLDWWPKPEYRLLGWLLPLPAFGCWGVPILFAIDWYTPALDWLIHTLMLSSVPQDQSTIL